jgi:hypothetical protein
LAQIQTRRCCVCGVEKPLTADHFSNVPSFAKGFSFYCNTCDVESRKGKPFALKKFEVDFVDDAAGVGEK